MSSRSALPLVLLAAVLVGLASLLLMDARPVEAAELPVSSDVPDRDGPAAPPEQRATEVVTGDVEWVVEERAALVRPERVHPPVRLVAPDGFVIEAEARLMAGAGTVRQQNPSGRHLVRFDVGDGAGLWRVVEFGRRSEYEVSLGPERRFSGVVMDTDGEPVAAAEVWFGRTNAHGEPILATTDSDGGFEIEGLEIGGGIPLVVRSEGLASTWRIVEWGGVAGAPYRIAMGPAAKLEVVFGGSVADPSRGAIRVAPARDGLGCKHYPFFWSVVAGARPLDSKGNGTLDDLPLGARVEVAIDHPDSVAPGRGAVIELRRKSERVVATVASRQVVEGRVVSAADGEPVVGARVTTCRANDVVGARKAGWLLSPANHAWGRAEAITDEAGRFRVAAFGESATRLEVRAPGRFVAEFEEVSSDLGDIPLPSLDAADEPSLELEGIDSSRHTLGRPAIVDVRVVHGADGQRRERAFTRLAVASDVVLRIDE